jgi:peptidoglycan/xylan/chitin deacetylase (PgdA/CDA1 family)
MILWICLGLGGEQEADLSTNGAANVEISAEGPPLVALTFDDGPRSSTTSRLLEGLSQREIPATFFLVGQCVAGNEELVRDMAQAGHQIGIHTYDHVRVTGLSRRDFLTQVEDTRAVLRSLLGEGEYWLRPPYGIVDRSVQQWADCPLILWSIDPEDWKDRDSQRIVSAVLERVGDGDIILMHDIYESSVDAALQVADSLLERGYCFVTVEQLLSLREVQPEAGQTYTAARPDF